MAETTKKQVNKYKYLENEITKGKISKMFNVHFWVRQTCLFREILA